VANHKSAKKRIRQTAKRRENNKWKNSRVRTVVKSLRAAIMNGDKTEAQKLLPQVQALYGKLSKTPAMKRATAARKTSRLAKQVGKLA
jgi:small subunit ribosomal protein S20